MAGKDHRAAEPRALVFVFLLFLLVAPKETASYCDPWEFKCNSGECVRGSARCNGHFHCSDGSDELACPTQGPKWTLTPCYGLKFQCVNGRCIYTRWRCDGQDDCGDNSDERHCPTDATMIVSPGGIAGISIAGMVLVVIIIGKITYFYCRSKAIRESRLRRANINISQIALGPSDLPNPRDMLAREPPPLYSSDMNIARTINPSSYELPSPPPVYSSRSDIHVAVNSPRLEFPPQYTSCDVLNTNSEVNQSVSSNQGGDCVSSNQGGDCSSNQRNGTGSREEVRINQSNNNPNASVSRSCHNITLEPSASGKHSDSRSNLESGGSKSKFNSCPDVTRAMSLTVISGNGTHLVSQTNEAQTASLEENTSLTTATDANRDVGVYNENEGYENRGYEDTEGVISLPEQNRSRVIPKEERQKIQRSAELQARLLVDCTGLPPRHPGSKRFKKNKRALSGRVLEGRSSLKPQGATADGVYRDPASRDRENVHQGTSSNYNQSQVQSGFEHRTNEEMRTYSGIAQAEPISRSLTNLVQLSTQRARHGSLSSVNTWNC